jgi:hypothetical protein
MYKELSAHLSQVTGVSTELHWQDAQNFDYNDSQIGAISISYSQEFRPESADLVQKILNHYGTWQEQQVENLKPNLLIKTGST